MSEENKILEDLDFRRLDAEVDAAMSGAGKIAAGKYRVNACAFNGEVFVCITRAWSSRCDEEEERWS